MLTQLKLSRPGGTTRGPAEGHSADAEAEVGRRYRFDHLELRTILNDMRFAKGDPGPGDPIPAFDLPRVGGGRVTSRNLTAAGPFLLIFGSSTCPVTDNAAPGLHELHARYGHRVRFVLVNVREAHPGDACRQPQTLFAKMDAASRLRDLHQFAFDVATDDVDGSLHRVLGPKPNSAYLVGGDGRIRFRAQWANDTRALAAALESEVSGRTLTRATSGGVIRPTLRILRNIAPVLDRAGRGAWADMWRVAPPMAAIALALKLLGVRPTPRPADNNATRQAA
jgi:thiol-disulfide isomerase/thioredoxin